MDWKRLLWGLNVLFLAGVLLAQTGCKPDYPKCETNDHCRESEQGQEEGKLYCVNGLCQECATDDHCGDPSLECNAGVCEKIPGYCTATADCPGNQKCRDNRCGPECMSNDDCEAGQICEGGSCVAEPECSTDADCEDGEMCQEGQCVERPAAECDLEPVYFGYDTASLSSDARDELLENAECIKEGNLTVRIEGYADERGTSEYNIALGERRAKSVQSYLENLGVSSGQLSIVSYGEERLASTCGEQGPDSCHRLNRRVEFDVQ
nr:OmpA family protein [Persicimonas caeni]